jgi:hypothetical protein
VPNEGNNLKVMCVLTHTRIKGNEEADKAAKESLELEVETSHKVVKTDCSGWTRKKMFENRQRAWLESGSEMVRLVSRTSLGTIVPRASHDDNNYA